MATDTPQDARARRLAADTLNPVMTRCGATGPVRRRFQEPNFAKSRGDGAKGIRIENQATLREGSRRHLRARALPVVVDAVVDSYALSLPSAYPLSWAKVSPQPRQTSIDRKMDSAIETIERNVRLV